MAKTAKLSGIKLDQLKHNKPSAAAAPVKPTKATADDPSKKGMIIRLVIPPAFKGIDK